MPRQREWTERDVQILHELYKVREMTKQQILQRFFEKNEKYGSRRLYIMRDAGLVVSEVHGYGSKEKRVRAAYYRLTELGIKLLREKDVVQETNYRARDLELTVQQRQYIVDANELHLRIPAVEYLDSRSIKQEYRLNRGNLTVGGFRTDQGDYMIFILHDLATDQTLLKVETEIHAGDRVSGYLVYYKSQSVKTRFERMCAERRLVTGGKPVYLLPYDDLGIGLTRWYILANNPYAHLQQLLDSYGQLVRVKDHSKYGFRYGLRREGEGEGKPPYLVEQLTGDMLTLERNLKFYTPELSRREGHRVVVICLEEQADHYRTEMEHERHVDILGIPTEAVETHFKRLGG